MRLPQKGEDSGSNPEPATYNLGDREMGDGRYAMGYPTDQKHCDKCRKKSFCFYESRYWYKGSVCSDCRKKIFEDYGRNITNHDYTVDQGPPLDEFCVEPFY